MLRTKAQDNDTAFKTFVQGENKRDKRHKRDSLFQFFGTGYKGPVVAHLFISAEKI